MSGGPGDDRNAPRRLLEQVRRARESSRIAPTRAESPQYNQGSLGMALRIGVEMVAGVGVGTAIGYGLDRWLGTAPVLTIIFFFMGAGAGALNTWRALVRAGFGPGGSGNES